MWERLIELFDKLVGSITPEVLGSRIFSGVGTEGEMLAGRGTVMYDD